LSTLFIIIIGLGMITGYSQINMEEN